MTEEEARNKWCPFARVTIDAPGVDTAWNRFPGNETPHGTLCIGSQCMAWRWASLHRLTFSDVDPDDPVIVTNIDKKSKTDGYCGLAGKP